MSNITLLDGGMGQELVRRSGGLATPLWSTQALIDQPNVVGDVHRDYVASGATVATSNTYALHRDRLRAGANHYAADGSDLPDRESQFEGLLETAMQQAQSVRGTARVAGSIGPLAASYRPDLHPDMDIAVPLYFEVAALIAPQSDIILFETIASISAARACLTAGRKTDLPVWLAFTVDDEDGTRLRSGELISEAVEIAKDADAALVNCSAPEAMPKALDVLVATKGPIGAYGNAFDGITKDFIDGGATANSLSARRDMGPKPYADLAVSWLDHGATILGGCCETGPAHIAEIAKRLQSAGHVLT